MLITKLIRSGSMAVGFLLLGMSSNCEEDKSPAERIKESKPVAEWYSMVVMATAYNSLDAQTLGNPLITFWGDTLVPGSKTIAVSHDLAEAGLTHNTPVKIEGLEGIFIVNDKMHSRWKKKIDIYMGNDRQKALEWGRRKVEICFPIEELSVEFSN